MNVLPKELTKKNSAVLPKPTTNGNSLGRIAQVFLNVDLRQSTDRLLLVANKELRKRGIDLNRFPRGNYLTFINDRADRFKLVTPARFTADGYVMDWVVAYYKSPQGRISLDVLYNIPKIFSGQHELEITNYAHEILDDHLKAKRRRKAKQIAAPIAPNL